MSEVKLPEGYKQTEVGVIPEDWEVKDIGEALTIKHGKDQKQVESSSGQYPIFGTGGQMGWANNFLYNKPSVLIGRKGSINKPRYIDVPFWTVDTLFYSQVHNGYDEKFMFYKFCLIDWMNYNEASGVPSLNASTISNVKISVPKKLEQTAIATALSDVDELIQSLEKLIAKKEAIKTGTMQQLLTGKTRLPEFATRDDGSSKGFKQTELGRIPEDWEVVRIIDNHIIATGNTPPTNDQRNYKGKFLFVSPADLGTNKLIHNTQKKLSLKGFKLARKFPKGSTLFTCIGSTIGKTGLATCELTSNQQINAVFPNEIDDFEFTYYALTHHSKRIKNKASEQAVPLINKTEFGQFEYMQPNELKEQTAIATILSDMDTEIQALQQRLEKTKDIKQGMMQQLLTGKVRLAH